MKDTECSPNEAGKFDLAEPLAMNCTNPDCQKPFDKETCVNWLFLREKLPDRKTFFQINLCDSCFKMMRIEESQRPLPKGKGLFPTLKFWEAMKAIEEGSKVRCVYWGFPDYVDKSKVCDWFETIPAAHHFFDEWELYEESPECKETQ